MKNQEEIKKYEKSQIQMLYLTFAIQKYYKDRMDSDINIKSEYLRKSTGKLSNDSSCLAF